jgi:hypothetical protein
MVGGSLWVLRLLPQLKIGRYDIAESGVKHQKSINQSITLQDRLNAMASYIGVSLLTLCTLLMLDFGVVPTVCYLIFYCTCIRIS